MLLSDLLGADVRCRDELIGHITDVRLVADERTSPEVMPRLVIHGFVISPHARTSTLGYERSNVRSPWPIAALQRWRHRGAFLVRWYDVEMISGRDVVLRPGYRPWSAVLAGNLTRGPNQAEHEN